MLDLGVEREHRRRVVRRRIGVREAAAERAAIADLRVADRRRRPRPAPDTCRGAARDVATSWWVVRGADLDRAVLLADAGQPGDARDVDERARLAQPQLHQRHQAVAAGDAACRSPSAAAASRARRRATSRGCSRMRWRSRLASLDDAPQLFGPQHHVDVLHAELAQRVDRRRRRCTASSRACRPRRRPWRRAG